MKTRKQIIEWLDVQPWKNEFYEAIVTSNRADMILYSVNLFDVFDWSLTKQGTVTWMERNEKYLEWYSSDSKPRSWKEYCEQNPVGEDEYYINGDGVITHSFPGDRNAIRDANAMSKDLCEAFHAYMKLIQLRNAWVKDSDSGAFCYKISYWDNDIFYEECDLSRHGLSFPTNDMAKEFVKTFGDLLEIAKPLL